LSHKNYSADEYLNYFLNLEAINKSKLESGVKFSLMIFEKQISYFIMIFVISSLKRKKIAF
jgi:hypothetical protein